MKKRPDDIRHLMQTPIAELGGSKGEPLTSFAHPEKFDGLVKMLQLKLPEDGPTIGALRIAWSMAWVSGYGEGIETEYHRWKRRLGHYDEEEKP